MAGASTGDTRALFAALADRTRLKILRALREAESPCGCGQIIRLVRGAAARGLPVREIAPGSHQDAAREAGGVPPVSDLAELLGGALSAGNLCALPLALAGGVVSGLNPCCLPLFPVAAACCAIRRERLRSAVWICAAFAAGAASATTPLGVLASLSGRSLTGLGGWTRSLIALVPLAMGLHLLDWLRLPLPALAPRVAPSGRAGTLFLYGLGLAAPILPLGTAAARLAGRLEWTVGRQRLDELTGLLLLATGFLLLWTA